MAENAKTIEDLKKEQLETLKQLGERIGSSSIGINKKDLINMFRKIHANTKKQLELIPKINEGKNREKVIDLEGAIDNKFSIMVGTIIFILRAINQYYADKLKLANMSFPKNYGTEISENLNEKAFFRYMDSATRYNTSLGGEQSQGSLVHVFDILRKITDSEGELTRVSKRRRQLKKLFGTELKELTNETLEDA